MYYFEWVFFSKRKYCGVYDYLFEQYCLMLEFERNLLAAIPNGVWTGARPPFCGWLKDLSDVCGLAGRGTCA
ncbi:hypothetical protein [Caulobacter sp. NIBR2454]|uniref:hypothetical protein n=1 Tax=Caulobacter sp. NIBR2454 TaxID=3015996 RepID=UPI0022B5F6B9|nr:hypothetical protein [Caulobacter sp. NIBR2454]